MIMGLDGLGLPLGPAKPESAKLDKLKPESLQKLEFQAVRRETKKISRERKSRYTRKKSQIDRLKRFKDGKISDTDFQVRVLKLSKMHISLYYIIERLHSGELRFIVVYSGGIVVKSG